MKANVFQEYEPPNVLQLRELAKPTPGDNEVLVGVHAASVNYADWSFPDYQESGAGEELCAHQENPHTICPILTADLTVTNATDGSQVVRTHVSSSYDPLTSMDTFQSVDSFLD